MKKEGASELGLFSAVLGVLSISIPVASFPFGVFGGVFVGIVLGIIALVMGIKSYKANGNGWAKAGITTGIIGILVSLLFLILAMSILAGIAQGIEELQQNGAFEGFAQSQMGAAQ